MKKHLYNYISSSSYKLADEQPSVSYIQQTDEISYQPKIVLGTLDEFLQFLGVNSISDVIIYKLESGPYIGINEQWGHTYVLVNKFQIKEAEYPSEINSDTYFDYDKVSYNDTITASEINFIITKDLLKQLSGVSLQYYQGYD